MSEVWTSFQTKYMESKYVRNFIMIIVHYKKMHTNDTNIGLALKPNFLHNRRPKIFAFHIFGLKCCLHPYVMIKLSKTSSPKKLFDYDCVTLYMEEPACLAERPLLSSSSSSTRRQRPQSTWQRKKTPMSLKGLEK